MRVNNARKLKSTAAAISIIGGDDAELATWQTILTPLHQQDDIVMAAGALLGTDGRSVGRINLDLPLHVWPTALPVGRPKEEEKHMAVLLAWFLFTSRNRGKRGIAFGEVASLFGYADQKKVERVCRETAQKLNISWPIPKDFPNLLEIIDAPDTPDTGDAAVLIPKCTWLKSEQGFELLGVGKLWTDRLEGRVYSGPIKLATDVAGGDFDFDMWKQRAGPIIISKIRSPRK